VEPKPRARRLTYPSGDFVQPASIAPISSANVWAIAALSEGEGVANGAVLLHWNGEAWTQVKVPFTLNGPQYITSDGHGGFWLYSPEYVKGSYLTYLFHYSDGRWTYVAIPHTKGDATQIQALATIPGTTSVWAAGIGYPSPDNPSGISNGVILKYGA
jgi:hypothetical protein